MVKKIWYPFLLSLPNKNSSEGYIAPKRTQTVRSKLGWLQMLTDAQMHAGINRQKATPLSHHALVGVTKNNKFKLSPFNTFNTSLEGFSHTSGDL